MLFRSHRRRHHKGSKSRRRAPNAGDHHLPDERPRQQPDQEIEKFIDQSGLPENLRPTVQRYTGQESGEKRKEIADNPPDILLTDGAINAGVMQPIPAAELAKNLGVRICTTGVDAERMAVDTAYDRRVANPLEDLDEETLAKIAELTGSRYFRATDVDGLTAVYRAIDQLEPVLGDTVHIRP